MKALLLLAAVAVLPGVAASAQPLHPRHRHAPRAALDVGGASHGRGGNFNAGAAQVPPQGFYDGYQGQGATVLKRGLAAQHDPGAAEELSPGAKQTATGGPAGGLPGFGGGM